MRLWSIHPSYLDAKGLVALWREALLAQQVLLGNTKGYKHHPQLNRFNKTVNPQGAIASYLRCVFKEADVRGYNFDHNKIMRKRLQSKICVTEAQINYEFKHLLKKVMRRDPAQYNKIKSIKKIEVHPLFTIIKGDIEEWEVV